jgi:hypothetical protein
MNILRRMVATFLIPCLVLEAAGPAFPLPFSRALLTVPGEFTQQAFTERPITAWANTSPRWHSHKMREIGALVRLHYQEHRAGRALIAGAIIILGFVLLLPDVSTFSASLDPHGLHHAFWTIVALGFVGSIAALGTRIARDKRIHSTHHHTFLFTALHLFRMVVIASFIAQFLPMHNDIFALSCLFRNAVVYLWARSVLLNPSVHDLNRPLWTTAWMFNRKVFATVTGILIMLSGPSGALHPIANYAQLLHSRGFWDWIIGMSVWLLWLTRPLLARTKGRPSVVGMSAARAPAISNIQHWGTHGIFDSDDETVSITDVLTGPFSYYWDEKRYTMMRGRYGGFRRYGRFPLARA